MNKKHLLSIMESRNAIVHRGKHNTWNEELAEYLITCLFFIQGTLKSTFEETLLTTAYFQPKLSNNPVWRAGAENFAGRIAEKYQEKTYHCPHCYSKSMVSKELFNFDLNEIEGFQCLTCFQDLQLEHQVGLIACCACDKRAFVFDILNEQANQTYNGVCLACDNKMDVRQCMHCLSFYFPNVSNPEVKANNKYFCSSACATP